MKNLFYSLKSDTIQENKIAVVIFKKKHPHMNSMTECMIDIQDKCTNQSS